MTIDTSKPIAWTIYGNMNTDDLKWFSRFKQSDSGALTHEFGYTLKSTGEVVQQNAAVLATGIEAFIEPGRFGKGESS